MVISLPSTHGILEGMTDEWDNRITAFWAAADDSRPGEMMRSMRALVDERPSDDPDALYEWASIHDFLGREREAVPLYRAALENGLNAPRRPQAVIQLASSLRSIGDADGAIALLENHPSDHITGDAAQAFLALALRDAGRNDEALRVALRALARTLPLYSRAVEDYAMEPPKLHG